VNVKIQAFTDLVVWQQGHQLVLRIYKDTSHFPQRESYALVDQMRRCVVSITSNIAEGFARKSNKEKAQFYFMSLGSLTELQNQLLISRDLSYLDKREYNELEDLCIGVHKLIVGLIKSSKILNT
jgi:four helix bundle protein